jgi:hypothetical protein
MNPHTPKWTPIMGVQIPNGFPNFHSTISGVKTHRLEEFFISLESYWNVYVWNGLALLIWTSKTQVMAKRKVGSLKVRNWPDLLTCRWHATYHWKVVDEGYNFASDLIVIRGLHEKLWAPKIAKIPTVGISKFLGKSQKTIWMWPSWKGAEYTIRGKVMASPKSGPWWISWIRVTRDSSWHQKCSNYALTTLCWFCVGPCKWSLLILPSPILELQHTPLPLQSAESQGACTELLTFPMFTTLDSSWVYQGAWERVNKYVVL